MWREKQQYRLIMRRDGRARHLCAMACSDNARFAGGLARSSAGAVRYPEINREQKEIS